tara:strand:+ start:316 stop:672 length:357 start_codon:yes stop_codon:yes gene_type:complete
MKVTKSRLQKIIFEEISKIAEELQKVQEIGKSGRPYFEDPQGQKKWKKRQADLAKSYWDDEDDKDPSPEHPEALESPLAESDFNLEQIDLVATKLHETRTELHNLVMWAMDQGYNPRD